MGMGVFSAKSGEAYDRDGGREDEDVSDCDIQWFT